MAISKLILNGEVQMDVTSNTNTSNNMLNGVVGTKNDGTSVTGNIASKSSSDLTVSGATVTAPAGYYASAASKSVASGTAGTPTATKGSVSNHAVSVTPSVTNTTGYITGGTKTGTAVSVSASELVSGTKSITENGTGIDVTNYASVDVGVQQLYPRRYIAHYVEVEGSSTNINTFRITNNTSGKVEGFSGTTSKINLGALIDYDEGDSLTLYVAGRLGAKLYINDTKVKDSGQDATLSYSWTAPAANTSVKIVPTSSSCSAYIYTASGGSSYTPISVGTIEVNASTTSTSAVLISDSITIDTSSLSTSKMVYVKVRDKAGKRNGYFYGTDMWFLWNMNGTTDFYPAKQIYRYTSNTISAYAPGTSTFYGVYVTNIDSAGALTIYARYNSNYTLTIDGTYSIDIYTLEWPNNISPYD